MDIASLSMVMSQSRVQESAGIAIMKMAILWLLFCFVGQLGKVDCAPKVHLLSTNVPRN